ncbi:putative propionate CoA-transferase [Aeropyrum pernix]|uniref:Putative propionate CoA-transferase n=1 Tax=Aeropyrum pernix TaxID=56636 RepID=A0A401HAS1_AERPX|nr:putative propionate CoA-transferase [Aeropyrum pernix]
MVKRLSFEEISYLGLGKTVAAEEALSNIRDGSVVAISGFNMAMTPEYLIEELYRLYLKTGHPKDLFIISDTFPGVPGRGLDRIAMDMYEKGEEEFISGMLLPFYGWSRTLQRMIIEEWFEAYTWSIGIMAYWFREVGSGRPGVLSRVGVETFLDPRRGGCSLNEKARKTGRVRGRILEIDGREYILYQAPKPDVGLLRGSTADEKGNVSIEDEGIQGTILNIAQAVKARPKRGFNVVQVLRVARFGNIRAKNVAVPGPLIDFVVVAPRDKHWQGASMDMDRRVSGEIITPLAPALAEPLPLDHRKIIARRVLLEMVRLVEEEGRPIIVNLGVGIPSLVAHVAVEEDVSDFLEITIESGPWGGIPYTGPDFGLAISPYAMLSIPDQFTIYEGGILDAASLGFLQVDREGNVNSSILPDRLPGPGGFSVIAAGSPNLFFAGGFTAGRRDIVAEDGRLVIRREGNIRKFVERVYRILYNPRSAMEYNDQKVLYITERAVFKLEGGSLRLVEVAPGVDIERDILGHMEFRPIIDRRVEEMDERIFRERRMEVKKELVKALRM